MPSPATHDRVLLQIQRHDGVTTEGLVAADLGLAVDTVKRAVRVLIKAGAVERGWDNKALCLTDAKRRDLAIDERVRTRR